MKILSLFANIGVAEAYLKETHNEVVLANELIKRRVDLYSKIYPDTFTICGDITEEKIRAEIVKKSLELGVELVMATPPCQGMSTAGQQNENDIRNELICQVVNVCKQIKPKYIFIENVPLFFRTYITINGCKILIPDYLERVLGTDYLTEMKVINTADYSVPQTRERALILMSRKDQKYKWVVPKKDEKKITMRDSIGELPILDPFVKDVSETELLKMFPHFYERKQIAEKISVWHKPPEHIKRQVIAMMHTPSGCTAFDNKIYFPKKEDGTPVKGYRNTYKRQNWDTAAYTVTMDNRKISSQNNVHPGRKYIQDGEELYSDARTLTLYEIMKIMTLPDNWPVPVNTSEAFLRRIIGEGIPPLFVKKVFEELDRGIKNE